MCGLHAAQSRASRKGAGSGWMSVARRTFRRPCDEPDVEPFEGQGCTGGEHDPKASPAVACRESSVQVFLTVGLFGRRPALCSTRRRSKWLSRPSSSSHYRNNSVAVSCLTTLCPPEHGKCRQSRSSCRRKACTTLTFTCVPMECEVLISSATDLFRGPRERQPTAQRWPHFWKGDALEDIGTFTRRLDPLSLHDSFCDRIVDGLERTW